jgi:hypothetical protein
MVEARAALATAASVSEDTLSVDLSDGRTIAAPLVWFPRLLHGTQPERDNWRLIGQGRGIHWPDLDEDVSVESLLAGKPSAESQQSLKAWLARRAKPSPPTDASEGKA